VIRSLAIAGIAFLLCAGVRTSAGEARIGKVLPHLMDAKGRISTAPGLFDRDGYQQVLRQSPGRVSGMRFDVQWSAPRSLRRSLTLRLELRTAKGEPGKPLVLEVPAPLERRWGGWSRIFLKGEDYAQAGDVLAWRAVLLDGGREVAEQRSFLW